MTNIFLVGVGGFLGSVMRYLVIGFLSHLAEARGMFEDKTRAFMFAGILGGFTTFSSFGNETLRLFRADQMMSAFANVAANVILALYAVWLGHVLATWLWR